LPTLLLRETTTCKWVHDARISGNKNTIHGAPTIDAEAVEAEDASHLALDGAEDVEVDPVVNQFVVLGPDRKSGVIAEGDVLGFDIGQSDSTAPWSRHGPSFLHLR
jgi:hypothetical protein